MADIIYKELSYAIIGAAMEVHRILGPGFLEAVYQAAPSAGSGQAWPTNSPCAASALSNQPV